MISSASGTEVAFEAPEWKNGVFTYALLQGLRSGAADRDADQQVRVTELRDYVITKVQELTACKQRPTAPVASQDSARIRIVSNVELLVERLLAPAHPRGRRTARTRARQA